MNGLQLKQHARETAALLAGRVDVIEKHASALAAVAALRAEINRMAESISDTERVASDLWKRLNALERSRICRVLSALGRR